MGLFSSKPSYDPTKIPEAAWSAWTQCNCASGGNGTQSRTYTNGTYLSTMTQPCTCKTSTPATYGPWSNWSECSATCGGGTQMQTRLCLSGTCEPSSLIQSQTCNTQKCTTNVPVVMLPGNPNPSNMVANPSYNARMKNYAVLYQQVYGRPLSSSVQYPVVVPAPMPSTATNSAGSNTSSVL